MIEAMPLLFLANLTHSPPGRWACSAASHLEKAPLLEKGSRGSPLCSAMPRPSTALNGDVEVTGCLSCVTVFHEWSHVSLGSPP